MPFRRAAAAGLLSGSIAIAGCAKKADGEAPVEQRGEAAAPPAEAGVVEASDPLAPPERDPGFDAIAEALDIETITPGVVWIGTEAAREILFVLASDTWRLEPTDAGVRLHVGAAARLAARLGLQGGDVVTTLNGRAMRGPADARAAMAAFAGGERVTVLVQRDGAERRILARAVDGSGSAKQRVEDIFAAGLHEAPEPAIERAVLVGVGAAADRLADQPGVLLELLGLPPEAEDIALDGASIAREDLARALGSAATGDRLQISASGTSISRRIVSGSIEAGDLEAALRRMPAPPRRRPSAFEELLGAREGAPPDPLLEPVADPPIEGIERVDEEHIRITRALVDEWLGDPTTLAKAARIVPSQRDGVVQGFKVYGVRRGSPVKALGFKNGDMITEIDGRALVDLTAAMEAFDRVRKAKKVSVAYERKETPMVLQIEIVPRL